MKNKQKIAALAVSVGIIAGLIILLIFGRQNYITKNGTKINISERIKEAKTEKGIRVENIQISSTSDGTYLLADITNSTPETAKQIQVSIVLLDERGNTLTTVAITLMELAPGETAPTQSAISEDYANAYDFKVEVTDAEEVPMAPDEGAPVEAEESGNEEQEKEAPEQTQQQEETTEEVPQEVTEKTDNP